MSFKPENSFIYDAKAELIGKLDSGELGIEKESLRILDSSISQSPHNEELGSALSNRFITTDFCEAQIEMITPPFSNKKSTLSFLDDLHHFFNFTFFDFKN